MAEAAPASPLPFAQASWPRRLKALLPEGLPLPQADWRARHRIVLGLLWAHVPAIFAFGLYMGETALHSLFEASIVAAAAVLAIVPFPLPARLERRRRTLRATIAGLGLVSTSAILTHLSGGYIEMHFHFFVMVAVMALYQDWPPFLLAILFVALHHGVFGALDAPSVFNHEDALAHPWKWAAIHAFFILGASAAAVTTWRYSEQARLKTEEANRDMQRAVSLLGATLESTADGILVVDREGRIASHNQQFATMWGIPRDVLASRDDDRALAFVLDQLQDPAAFLAKVKELYAQPEAESHDALRFKDGRVFERYSKPQRLDGVPVGRVWSFHDVTEQRRAEADRLVAGQRLMEIRRLEEVNRFKTTLLNTASHELNTPLTPLRLQLRLLKDPSLGPLSDRHQRSVQVLDRNLERLSSLVQNVLDVARLQSEHLTLRRQPVVLAEAVAETLEAFDEVARQAGVRLECCHAPDPAVVVDADRNRLAQVLFNLVSNAVKHTRPGGMVAFDCHRADGFVRVEVKDTGRGLDPQETSQLFQPFSQLPDAEASQGGTGLGLYICRGIVEAHGGRIGVDSPGLGHGSTFWFELPAARPGPAPPVAHAAA